MQVGAILKKKMSWPVVFAIGMTIVAAFIPYELFNQHADTCGSSYTPLGLFVLMLGLVLFMLILQLLSVLNPYGYFILAGVIATLIIERLIGAHEKNQNSRPPSK